MSTAVVGLVFVTFICLTVFLHDVSKVMQLRSQNLI